MAGGHHQKRGKTILEEVNTRRITTTDEETDKEMWTIIRKGNDTVLVSTLTTPSNDLNNYWLRETTDDQEDMQETSLFLLPF